MRLVSVGALAAFAAALVLISSLAGMGASTAGGSHALASGGLGAASWVPSAEPAAPSPGITVVVNPCSEQESQYLGWFGNDLPLTVDPAWQSSCALGSDQASLSFVSNGAGSGARSTFSVELPSAGATAGGAITSLGLGLWVAGVPCSLEGQSFLDVQLEPPFHYSGANTSANWTVQAPVDDLVPAGSCDPQCQNDSAVQSIGGVPYCEDDIVTSGIGGPTSSGWGSFAPGDVLTVTFVGAFGSGAPIGVYLNDSTHPSSALSWSYTAGVTADNQALTPYFDAASPSARGWGNGLDVQAIYQNCPSLGGAGAPSPCNSYNAPAVAATELPSIVGASFWNATSLTYANPYAWTATASSSGACQGGSMVCSDFASYGGTGSYPTWSLRATAGRTVWGYGGPAPGEVTDWGGAAGQFASTGSPTLLDPTSISSLNGTAIGNAVYLDAVVADPNAVTAVDFGAYFCFGSSTPSVGARVGVLTSSVVDTTQDGNWTANFSTGTYKGTVEEWVSAESTAGVWSSPVYGSTGVTGVTACTFPGPSSPTFTYNNLTAVGGGFFLNWTDPSPAIKGYTVMLNASGNATVQRFPVGDQTHILLIAGLSASLVYSVSVEATDAAGLTAVSATLNDSVPLPALNASLVGPAGPFWVGNAVATFTATATGGTAPYTFGFTFGDGTTATVVSSNNSVSSTHNFASYFGDAAARVTVTDAAGEASVSSLVLVAVLATPLGVPQSIAAGSNLVNVSWLLAPSPAGAVSRYSVFSTTNASEADWLTGAGQRNDSARGIDLWNTTGSYLILSVTSGAPLFAVVLAWDSHGEGMQPSVVEPLNATAVLFAAGPVISTPPGGPAPFTDHLSDFVTNGTNDVIVQATYSSGFNDSVNAAIAVGGGGVWMNASLTLTTPGIHVVLLHASDEFADFTLQLADVYVSTGSAPTLSLSPPGPAGWNGWAGSALSMRALATGGVGPYQFDWAFGDGELGTGPNVSHTFAAAGNYTMTITASDNTTGGSVVHSQAIEIFAPPTVAIASRPGPDGALSWSFVAITGGGSGTPTVSWSFGDGDIGSGPSVNHDYGSVGKYTVNVTTTDPTGKSASATLTFTLVGSTSGGSGGGSFLGASAGTWGTVALSVGVFAAVLLVVILLLVSRRRPGSGTAIESWRATDDTPASEKH
ncbi:MAG: PKD domain-containing protein [Thermoplasmata archaeon]|nr:PKD domain-containing protein [Thermoplasmata archaeon]